MGVYAFSIQIDAVLKNAKPPIKQGAKSFFSLNIGT